MIDANCIEVLHHQLKEGYVELSSPMFDEELSFLVKVLSEYASNHELNFDTSTINIVGNTIFEEKKSEEEELFEL